MLKIPNPRKLVRLGWVSLGLVRAVRLSWVRLGTYSLDISSPPQERGYRGQSPLKDEFVAKTPLLSINSSVRGLCPLYPRSCGGLDISRL